MRWAAVAVMLIGCMHVVQPARRRVVVNGVMGSAAATPGFDAFGEGQQQREFARFGARARFEYNDGTGTMTGLTGSYLVRPGVLDREEGTAGAVGATFGQVGELARIEANLTILTGAAVIMPSLGLAMGHPQGVALGVVFGPADPLFTLNVAQAYGELRGEDLSVRVGIAAQGQLINPEEFFDSGPIGQQFIGKLNWAITDWGVDIDASIGEFTMIALGAFYDFK